MTFLLSDIDASVRLWDADATAMAMASARHDEIIEGLCGGARRRGGPPPGQGDSRFAVFARAADGVAAALAIQRTLGAEAWPTAGPLRVRLALHTGGPTCAAATTTAPR